MNEAMKIGMYLRGLSEPGGGGVWEFLRHTMENMAKLIEKQDSLYIFHTMDKFIFNCQKPNVHPVYLKTRSKIVADYMLAPRIINQLNLDAVWFPKNVIPFGIQTKTVVTMHDLAFFMPELNAYLFGDTLYMRTMMKSSCKRADKIIAVSDNTKKDIEQILNIDPGEIIRIYEGVDPVYRIIRDERHLQSVKEKYQLPDSFILFTGSLTPRKNVLRLIAAFNKISSKTNLDLIITGNKQYKTRKEQKFIEGNPRIRALGLIDSIDMPALYNLAEIYIYPSLYEGFGLPILEAQACGIPVIASKTSSLPEVGGDSVFWIDPYDIDDIAAAILKVNSDTSLQKSLIKKGFANITRFSWEKTAKETLSVLKRV